MAKGSKSTPKSKGPSRPKPMVRKPGISKGRPYSCGGKLKG